MVGCSGAAAPAPVSLPPPPPPADAAVPDAPVRTARGGACHAATCADGLTCGALPQGYCLSGCDRCADGQCVDTWADGARCLARCATDRDCRRDEGYACDAAWHACLIPNSAAIVPRLCTADAHDDAFGPPEPLTTDHAIDPTAALADDGTLVALYARDDGTLASGVTGTQPRLVPTAAGELTAVWLGATGIELATTRDGTTWTAPRAAQAAGDDALAEPNVAPGYALYGSHGALRIRALGAPTAVTPVAGMRASALVGADRRLHVVALDGGPLGGYGSADQRIQYTVSRDGGRTFATPIQISARDEELPWFAAAPALALDERRGWLYVAYVRGGHDARWDIVVVALNGKQTRRAVIGDGCSIHMAPALALDPVTGTLHVGYYDSVGFAHATCTPGSCKVAGAIGTFPVSTARSGPRALGDRAALVIDNKRRTLHAVWASPAGVLHAVAKLQPTAAR